MEKEFKTPTIEIIDVSDAEIVMTTSLFGNQEQYGDDPFEIE